MKTLTNKFLNSTIWAEYLATFKFYKHIYDSRKALNRLSDEILEDIGVSRAEAQTEAEKAFWQTTKVIKRF